MGVYYKNERGDDTPCAILDHPLARSCSEKRKLRTPWNFCGRRRNRAVLLESGKEETRVLAGKPKAGACRPASVNRNQHTMAGAPRLRVRGGRAGAGKDLAAASGRSSSRRTPPVALALPELSVREGRRVAAAPTVSPPETPSLQVPTHNSLPCSFAPPSSTVSKVLFDTLRYSRQ